LPRKKSEKKTPNPPHPPPINYSPPLFSNGIPYLSTLIYYLLLIIKKERRKK